MSEKLIYTSSTMLSVDDWDGRLDLMRKCDSERTILFWRYALEYIVYEMLRQYAVLVSDCLVLIEKISKVIEMKRD